jgi:Resolvase, N terminal domain
MASLAQMERELIVERTQAGLAAAKAQGRVGGRKRKMTNSKVESAKKLLASGILPKDVARDLTYLPQRSTDGFLLPLAEIPFFGSSFAEPVPRGAVLWLLFPSRTWVVTFPCIEYANCVNEKFTALPELPGNWLIFMHTLHSLLNLKKFSEINFQS